MLAAILCIDEDEAAHRLDVMVLVTADRDNATAQHIAGHVQAMLSRTITASTTLTTTGSVAAEVIVGRAMPRTLGTPTVWVGPVPEGILIAREPFRQIRWTGHSIFGLIAACYACGMALRFALDDQLPYRGDEAILVSPSELLGTDLGAIDGACNLGQATLAGAGAVGNGFLYGLRHFDPRGTLHVVDPKEISDGILNRCIWYGTGDIGHPKAERLVLHAQLHFPHLTLNPHAVTVQSATAQLGIPLSRLITTVDSRRTRRSLQREIPWQVFDASTTGIEEVVLHFNEQPSQLACLSCVYRIETEEVRHEEHVAEALGVGVSDVRSGFISEGAAALICATFPDLLPEIVIGKAYDTLFKARCAQGMLKSAADRQVLAPFCFVSMLAGAYLALEVVRRINTGRTAEPFNYWRLSPWHGAVLELRALRPSRPDCEYCAEPLMRDVATSLWADSRQMKP